MSPKDASKEKERWASNVVSWDEERFKMTVRSFDAKFANTTFVRRKNNLIQIDYTFLEIEFEPTGKNGKSEEFSEQIELKDKSVLPHTTIVIPEDVARLLHSQLTNALMPQQQSAETAEAAAE